MIERLYTRIQRVAIELLRKPGNDLGIYGVGPDLVSNETLILYFRADPWNVLKLEIRTRSVSSSQICQIRGAN